MTIRPAICFTALLAFSGTLQAQICSGGVGGGMDVTGNDCNGATFLVDASPDSASAARSIPMSGQAQALDKPVSAALSAVNAPQPASASAGAAQLRPEQAAVIGSRPDDVQRDPTR